MSAQARRVARPTLAVVAVGVVLTVGLGVAARAAHVQNEERLLGERTSALAAVLDGSIQALETPLLQAAAVAELVGTEGVGTVSAVRQALSTQVGQDARFVSASVWPAGELRPELVLGEEPELADRPLREVEQALEPAIEAPNELHVIGLFEGEEPRLGFAVTSSTFASSAVVVYAEQSLPAASAAPLEADSPFAKLDYTIHLGADDSAPLLVASREGITQLTGRRASRLVAFGDTTLTVVTAPVGVLGSDLLARLPWIVVIVGGLTTAAGAALVERIQRGRRGAESLADEIARLYDEQHHIAHALQLSLLPARLPEREDIDLAARYVPGGRGVEVGGDWYDVLELDGALGLVIGDAVGHDISASTVMAGMRHSAHALLAQHMEPAAVLEAINGLDRVRDDFVTMAVATLDLHHRTLTVASAGHPPPLLIAGDRTCHLEVPVGPPVGPFAGVTYRSTKIELPTAGTLLLYTDGLYERPGEDVEEGMHRLRHHAAGLDPEPEALLDRLFAAMVGDDLRDDVAMLAIRWR